MEYTSYLLQERSCYEVGLPNVAEIALPNLTGWICPCGAACKRI